MAIVERATLMHPNPTMTRFGYPLTLIHAYEHWVVLLREDQPTLGSLVLCSTSAATAYSALPRAGFTEMHDVIRDIEKTLSDAFAYDKINYLMLMMSDPNVHYHVIPRYASERSACGITLLDQGWPRAPVLADAFTVDGAQREALCAHIQRYWPRS
jgi:diadenosine tetraphosphate (Ap4A) HIT family hydrolase